FDALPDRLLLSARRKSALLRLAVLLHRSHESDGLPPLRLVADGPRLRLELPPAWLEDRALLRADLADEKKGMAGLGIEFEHVPTCSRRRRCRPVFFFGGVNRIGAAGTFACLDPPESRPMRTNPLTHATFACAAVMALLL